MSTTTAREITYNLFDEDARFPVRIELFIGYKVRKELGGADGWLVEWWLNDLVEVRMTNPAMRLDVRNFVDWRKEAERWAQECGEKIRAKCLNDYEVNCDY